MSSKFQDHRFTDDKPSESRMVFDTELSHQASRFYPGRKQKRHSSSDDNKIQSEGLYTYTSAQLEFHKICGYLFIPRKGRM